MKKSSKKKVLSHLKSDIKTFKKEAHEDKKLMKSIKDAHKAKQPKKKHEKKHKKDAPKNPKTKYAKSKVKKVMHEYKEGKLHSGSKKGPQVTNPKQAIAIALSEARRGKKR